MENAENMTYKPELPMIYGCLERCMQEIGTVTKSAKMAMEGRSGKIEYAYRSIDAVYNALQPAMIKAGVTVVPIVLDYQRIPKAPEKKEYQNTVIVNMAFRWCAADGSYVETRVVNEGQDSGDKAFSKAMANAFKYACFMTFVIPTQEMDTFDPDHYRPEIENEKAEDAERKAEKKPLRERVAQAAKVKQETAQAVNERLKMINDTAAKVGYPNGLNTEEAKLEFGAMVSEVIKAGKAVDKKTGDMSPEELKQCMQAVVETFGGAQ